MRYENVDVADLLVLEKLNTKLPQTGTRIENDNMFAAADLDAWRIATVSNGFWSRAGNTSADPPKANAHMNYLAVRSKTFAQDTLFRAQADRDG